ncbi:MAG: glycerophosphodiester phosphodiesterase, partial [Deinococcus sp.]
ATLSEAIEVAQGHTGLRIDLKAADLQDPIGRCLGAAGFREAMICGGYLDTLEHLKADLPHVAVSLTPDPAFYRSLAQELPRLPFLDALTVYWRTVGPHMAQAVQAQGVALLAWTVDYPHVARKVLEAGADGITSNNLELLLDLPRRTP